MRIRRIGRAGEEKRAISNPARVPSLVKHTNNPAALQRHGYLFYCPLVLIRNSCSSIYAVVVLCYVLWQFYEAIFLRMCGCEGGWSGGGRGASSIDIYTM